MIKRDYLVYVLLLIIIIYAFADYRGCINNDRVHIDTIESIQVIDRPITIRDTIKVKSIKVLIKDTLINASVLPCDSSFIVISDTIVTNTHDTVNIGFNYLNDSSFFNMHFRPRKDTIVSKTITIPESKTDYNLLIGTFGIGLFLGLLAGISK